MEKKYIIASVAIGAVLIASPAFADSDKGKGEREGRIGAQAGAELRLFDHDEKREEKRDHKEYREMKATSTRAIHGTVTAIAGTTITMTGKDGVVYTVNAANAEVEHGTLAEIVVGDTVKAKGTLNGSVMVASELEEKGIKSKDRARNPILEKINDLRIGIVTAVTPNGFTIVKFGTGTTTVTTNASTTIKAPGKNATSSIEVGTKVIVAGATSTADTITANFVLVLNEGLGWLKHWFGR